VTLAELLASFTTPPWREIGRSIEARPIVARSWSGGAPPVLLFGSIHGDEPLGTYCLRWLVDELDARSGSPARETWIVPVANPDGFLAGVKNNARGVDLNRNYPATNWKREHRPNYDPGAAPASEPETKTLVDLIDRIGATRLVALHSPFRVVNYDGPAQDVAERMAAKNGYGASADIGYPTPGSFGSCYGVDRKLEVITLEIPPMTPEQAWRENREALHEALR
jgi:protein MpaA